EIDDAGHHVVGVARHLEAQLLVGEQRRQVLEAWAGPSLVGRHAVDGVDAQQSRILLAAARRPAGAADVVALAQGEAPHLAERDIHVLAARQIAATAEEAVALVAEVEQTLDGHGLALELGLAVALVLGLAVAPVTVAS